MSPEAIEEKMLALAHERGEGKTICPSDVARALVGSQSDTWGAIMTPVRRVAVKLALDGRIVIYRKGKPADPLDFRGVYRLGLPSSA